MERATFLDGEVFFNCVAETRGDSRELWKLPLGEESLVRLWGAAPNEKIKKVDVGKTSSEVIMIEATTGFSIRDMTSDNTVLSVPGKWHTFAVSGERDVAVLFSTQETLVSVDLEHKTVGLPVFTGQVVREAIVSFDGKWIVAIGVRPGKGVAASRYSMSNGECLNSYFVDDWLPSAIAISQDDQYLAVAGERGIVTLFRVADGTILGEINPWDRLAWHLDNSGPYLQLSSRDRYRPIKFLGFIDNGQTLLSSGNPGELRRIDVDEIIGNK